MKSSHLVWALGVVSLFGLAACGQNDSADQDTAVLEGPNVPAPWYEQPLNVLGNEPFWSVHMRPDGVTYTPIDAEPKSFQWIPPTVEGDKATFALSGDLSVVVVRHPCTDSMSGLDYPLTAQLREGDNVWPGCAAYADGGTEGAPEPQSQTATET